MVGCLGLIYPGVKSKMEANLSHVSVLLGGQSDHGDAFSLELTYYIFDFLNIFFILRYNELSHSVKY